jgi:preprotein translocase subunit SecA
MLNRIVRLFAGDPSKRTISKYIGVVEQINQIEGSIKNLSEEALRNKTEVFRARLAQGETLDDLLPEAFAVVREVSRRSLGLRHYDVQLIGGIVLHEGSIAEMRTGEGKTLVATLPLYLNALAGKGTHLITVNDYLARRDARWMAPIYLSLGLSVGVLQMASRTESGKKAFLVDLERESPHEDQHQLRMVSRQEAYAADITYGTNSEFGFDYLRDNMTMRLEDRVQRGHFYAIIDEVDNVLIDEARTPLIISGPASEDTGWYMRMAQIVRQLRSEDYEISEKDRTVTLTEIGEAHAEELLGVALSDPDRPEDLTPEQARLRGYLEQALRAQFLFKRNKDYIVQAGKVIIVDDFTGRLMPGRRWSDGLHQAVEAKENARVLPENVTYATITIQNYFRMYEKLSGMSGTALTEAEEFAKIYKLEVVAIPTNLEYRASRADGGLVETEGRDEQGYKYLYYAQLNDPQKEPVYWKRKDYPDIIYRTEEAKFRAIAQEILRYHAMGRPILVGTTSVELSERIAGRLNASSLRTLAQVLILRKAWFHHHNAEEDGRQVAELDFLNNKLEELSQADLRKLARELGISLTPQDEENLPYLLEVLSLDEIYAEQVVACLQSGIPRQVLNARKHDEEGKIIADAGALGAVTIATNMAGRGVDIRLGGEVPEAVINPVRQLLSRQDIAERMARNNIPPIEELPIRDFPLALNLVDPDELRSRAGAVAQFMDYLKAEAQVRKLGGLHVIGSERHEARRIDNQLRGRSARQGDPGSSRFYLSMQDDLMRIFGGQQAEAVMARMNIDDSFPLEFGMVSRLVEQSQTRVEGANFDVRKHLLEYDDVLNSQRSRIYGQRDRIFTKQDLSDDVTEMLRTEVKLRVPEALEDAEGPWKLLAWLEHIQPSLSLEKDIFPSYTLRLLLDDIRAHEPDYTDLQQVRRILLDIARKALEAENQHLLLAVRAIFDGILTRFETQIDEQIEMLDTFLEGLELEREDEQTQQRSPREIVEELSTQLRIPLRLSPEQQRALRSNPESLVEDLRPIVQENIKQQSLTRMFGAIERRLDENLELAPTELTLIDWDEIEVRIYQAVESLLQHRVTRLVGDSDAEDDAQAGGLIGRDLDSNLAKFNGNLSGDSILPLLLLIPQGSVAIFDKKTHRRVVQRTTRLSYIYHAAHLLDQREPNQIVDEVLDHLEQALAAIRHMGGMTLWPQLAGAHWDDLEPWLQERLAQLLDPSTCNSLKHQPMSTLSAEDVVRVVVEIGGKAITEAYRPLMLSVITELWVEYLTQMEALRVSVGLEAYAQRDPLVQYKSRASELFANLLSSMRLAVISRMFTYRPRQAKEAAIGLRRAGGNGQESALPPSTMDEVLPEWEESAEEDATLEPIEDQMETPVFAEADSTEDQASQAGGARQKLSRSQKRRRKRR